jgi:hypothetical protein
MRAWLCGSGEDPQTEIPRIFSRAVRPSPHPSRFESTGYWGREPRAAASRSNTTRMGDCHPSHRHATEVEDLLLVSRVEGEVAQCPTAVLLHHLHVAEALHRLHDRSHPPQLPDQHLPAAQRARTHTHTHTRAHALYYGRRSNPHDGHGFFRSVAGVRTLLLLVATPPHGASKHGATDTPRSRGRPRGSAAGPSLLPAAPPRRGARPSCPAARSGRRSAPQSCSASPDSSP